MTKIRALIESLLTRLFALYVVFAGIATVVDFAVLAALVQFAGVNYMLAAAFSYICGMITNFSLNKFFNFRNKSRAVAMQFGVFIAVALVGLVINQAVIYVLVEFCGVYYLLAKIISVVIVMFWSFFGHKNFTFALFK